MPPTSPPPGTPEPQVSVHRWPWRTGEFASMAFMFTLTLLFGYWIFTMRRTTLGVPWLVGTVVAAFAVVYWLYRVKKTRTTRSALTVTITGTRIAVASPGPVGDSAVDVAKVHTISYRRFHSDHAFVLSDGTQAARVPVRTTQDPYVRTLVEAAFAGATTISEEARDLHQQMLNA